MPRRDLYECDFYAWANALAVLLRAGGLAQADIERMSLAIESRGETKKRERVGRRSVLRLHPLKWRCRREKPTANEDAFITVQRMDIVDRLDENPSLKPLIDNCVAKARRRPAASETSLPARGFPSDCPWTFDAMTAEDFWPDV
jgi:hypothetical protein